MSLPEPSVRNGGYCDRPQIKVRLAPPSLHLNTVAEECDTAMNRVESSPAARDTADTSTRAAQNTGRGSSGEGVEYVCAVGGQQAGVICGDKGKGCEGEERTPSPPDEPSHLNPTAERTLAPTDEPSHLNPTTHITHTTEGESHRMTDPAIIGWADGPIHRTQEVQCECCGSTTRAVNNPGAVPGVYPNGGDLGSEQRAGSCGPHHSTTNPNPNSGQAEFEGISPDYGPDCHLAVTGAAECPLCITRGISPQYQLAAEAGSHQYAAGVQQQSSKTGDQQRSAVWCQHTEEAEGAAEEAVEEEIPSAREAAPMGASAAERNTGEEDMEVADVEYDTCEEEDARWAWQPSPEELRQAQTSLAHVARRGKEEVGPEPGMSAATVRKAVAVLREATAVKAATEQAATREAAVKAAMFQCGEAAIAKEAAIARASAVEAAAVRAAAAQAAAVQADALTASAVKAAEGAVAAVAAAAAKSAVVKAATVKEAAAVKAKAVIAAAAKEAAAVKTAARQAAAAEAAAVGRVAFNHFIDAAVVEAAANRAAAETAAEDVAAAQAAVVRVAAVEAVVSEEQAAAAASEAAVVQTAVARVAAVETEASIGDTREAAVEEKCQLEKALVASWGSVRPQEEAAMLACALSESMEQHGSQHEDCSLNLAILETQEEAARVEFYSSLEQETHKEAMRASLAQAQPPVAMLVEEGTMPPALEGATIMAPGEAWLPPIAAARICEGLLDRRQPEEVAEALQEVARLMKFKLTEAVEAAIRKIEWRRPTIFEEQRKAPEEEMAERWQSRKEEKKAHGEDVTGWFEDLQQAREYFEHPHLDQRAKYQDTFLRCRSRVGQAVFEEVGELLTVLRARAYLADHDCRMAAMDETGDAVYCLWLWQWLEPTPQPRQDEMEKGAGGGGQQEDQEESGEGSRGAQEKGSNNKEVKSSTGETDKEKGEAEVKEERQQRKVARKERKQKGQQRREDKESATKEAAASVEVAVEGYSKEAGEEAAVRTSVEAVAGEAAAVAWSNRLQQGRWRALCEGAQEEDSFRRFEEGNGEEEVLIQEAEAWWKEVESQVAEEGCSKEAGQEATAQTSVEAAAGEAAAVAWSNRLQQGRWRALCEGAQEEDSFRRFEEGNGEEEVLIQEAEAWWKEVECKAKWEQVQLAVSSPSLGPSLWEQRQAGREAQEQRDDAVREDRLKTVKEEWCLLTSRRIKEEEMNRVNTQIQKAKARREKLLRASRRQYEAGWQSQAWQERTGAPGKRPTWRVQGETAVKLRRARQQEVGVGWKPDARPAAMRRRRYRPQGMRKVQQRQGMASTMACLGLLLAMGSEGAAPGLAAAAVGSEGATQALAAAVAAVAVVATDTWGSAVGKWAATPAGPPVHQKGWGKHTPYSPEVRLNAQQEAAREAHDLGCARFKQQRQRAGEKLAEQAVEARWQEANETKRAEHAGIGGDGGEQTYDSQIAVTRRAKFTATSAEVELLQGTAVVGKVAALLDSGAVLSCTSARHVKGLRSRINKEQAAALCTADGSPMQGVQGVMKVRFRFRNSKRVFEKKMQVVDADVPFILGMDFLKQEKAILNYASGELCLPPVPGWPAMATPMQMGVLVPAANMIAAVSYVLEEKTIQGGTAGGEGFTEPYLREGQSMSAYAAHDVVVEPGSYAHVDARLEGQVHQADTLLLESTVKVCQDRDALNEAESWREQAADLRHLAGRCGGDEKKQKRMLQQCEALEQQASKMASMGEDKAQFPAVVHPWMDEGSDWMGVSTVLHNQGSEALVIRKGCHIAAVSVMQEWESGPQLWDKEVECPPESCESQLAQVSVAEGKAFVQPQQQYLFQPGDWRYGKSGGEIVAVVQEQMMEEFLHWHIQWYDKLVFGEKLPQHQKTQLAMLLFAHKKIISLNPKAPSVIKGVKHYIPFDTSKVVVPHKGRLRRLSPAEREAQDDETRVLLESGLVRPSTSPWGAGTVIVPKKDGGRRYAIDYRAVNKVTVKNCHPLPRCDDICDAVNGAFIPRQCPSNLPQRLPSMQETKQLGVPAAWQDKARQVAITSAFDIAAGFHGVEVAEEDKYKTAFSTWGYGLLEWNRMPFGLHGAPQTFQAGMESVLRGLCNLFCVIYIDDCACFSTDFETHVGHLGAIFERLDCANISIKIPKCIWGTDTLPLLGHLIVTGKLGGVQTDPKKVEALAKAAVPETTGQIKSFLGACSYYRKFIPNFAVMAEPLRKVEKLYSTKTARIGDVLRADKKALRSYEALKAALVNSPVLQAPDFTKPFLIISDASKFFVGGCLCQRSEDGVERPIAYTSRPLRGAELNYAITDLEGLAMVHCCSLWRHFISSSPTICITDHVSLTSLLTKQEHGSGRQARYAMDLQEFDLQIVHRAGESRKMALADFVSRTPLDPDLFEQKLQHKNTKVGSQRNGYKDSQLWAEGSGEATIQFALEQAVVTPEVQLQYNLPPGEKGTKSLVSAVHADLFRREQAWGRCKPADPDTSRTIEMLDTICSVMVQEAPMSLRGSTVMATAKSKATAAGSGSAAAAPMEGEEEEEEEEEEDDEREEEEDEETTEKATTKPEGTGGPTRQDLIDGIAEVPRWQAMRRWKLEGKKPLTKELQHFVDRYEANYECDEDGALWRLGWRDEEARLSPVKQLVVPPRWQEAVVRVCHASPEGAHRKTWTTYHKLRERFWFPNAHALVNRVIKECPVCQLHGASQRKPPIEGHAEANRPGDQWVCDLIHLKRSAEGYAYILVCVDVFSRYVELVPLKGGLIKATKKGEVDIKEAPDSKTTAQAFMNAVVQHWGIPAVGTTTDGGPEFKALWKEMHEELRLKHRLSTPHHSDGHGLVERANRSVIEAIAKLVQDDDEHWQTSVPWCQLALNAAPHRALFDSGGAVLSPAEAHTGTRLHLAIDFDTDPEALGGEVTSRRVQDALAAQDWVQEQRLKYNGSMEEKTAGRPRRTFALGDKVCLQYPDHDKLPQKLKEKYAGPYTVMVVPDAGSASYVLRREAGGARQFAAHIRRIKAYHGGEGQALGVTAEDIAVAKSRLYAVARVLAHREAPSGKEYQVLWEPCLENDWDDEEVTWESEASLKCPDRVQEYHKRGSVVGAVTATVSRMVGAVTAGVGQQHSGGGELPVQSDILQGDPTTLVLRICTALKLDPTHVLLVWASTPCETFSRADPSNITRGHHYRNHSNPEKPPKSDDLSDLKVQKAVDHDHFLPRLQQMVAADRQRGLQYNFVFENPRASLRCRPYMQMCAWPKVVEVVRRTVDLCAFRHVYKKGTDLWTSLSQWFPCGTTGNGRCGQRCESGEKTEKGYRHYFALGVEPERELQGPGVTARRNHMPKMLLKEVMRAAQVGAGEQRRVVIDLCAGYRSLKGICEAEGLIYVPVDIRYSMAKDAVAVV